MHPSDQRMHSHHHGYSGSHRPPFEEKKDEEEEENEHFANVIFAFNYYETDSLKEVARMEEHFKQLSADDQMLLCDDVDNRIMKIKEAITVNQAFIDLLLANKFSDVSYDNLANDKLSDEKESDSLNVQDICDSNRMDQNMMVSETTVGGLSYCNGNGSYEIHDANVEKGTTPIQSESTAHPQCSSEAPAPLQTSPSSHRISEILSVLSHRNSDNSVNYDPVVLSRNITKVRGTLRQFIREWSEEGIQERKVSFDPLLEALNKYIPIENAEKPPRVLCPGSGLGRLPFEVVKRGYACQGNEFSYFMLLGSDFILNYSVEPNSCQIYPFCLSTSNRRNHSDHLKAIHIPDHSPSHFISPGQDFSMCAGEFVEVYSEQIGMWDAILTCFFIDTAKNIILYIRTIANILRPGGLWANIGPLLYHYAEMPAEMSVELSWEEVRAAFGANPLFYYAADNEDFVLSRSCEAPLRSVVISLWFTIEKEEWIDAFYTSNRDSMMQVLYHAVHFVAIRNDVEVKGTSAPVMS